MIFPGTQIITPRKSPAVTIGVVLVAIILLLPSRPEFASLKVYLCGIILLVFGALYFSLSKTYIILGNDDITFKLSFKKEKIISWNQINSSRLEWHLHSHTADLSWIIFYNNTMISFQPSYYGRKDLTLIAEALIIKCPALIIDKRIKNISQGIFPWYLF